MKKVFTGKIVLIAVLFVLLVSAFSVVVYTKTRSMCSRTEECCIREQPQGSSEMLWDILSRQFVSAVHLP
jgi:cell division protein FtsL